MRKLLLTLITALTLGACSTNPPPIVVPDPPTQHYLRGSVRGADGLVPPGVDVMVYDDVPNFYECEQVDIRFNCQIPMDTPNEDPGIGAHLSITAPDYEAYLENFAIVDRDTEHGDIDLVPVAKNLPRLIPNGLYLQLENGQRFTVLGMTDFNLLSRYIHGEDITPQLRQRQEIGFNFLRVFTAFNVCPNGGGCGQPIGRLVPREHPDYYQKVSSFLKLLSRYDLRAELVGFTGPYTGVLDNHDEMVVHWESLISAVAGHTNVYLELVNEFNHPANQGIPFDHLREPGSGILAAHGSGIKDSLPVEPHWSIATYHPGFGPEWHRKLAHNSMEDVGWPSGKPVINNETTRYPDNEQSLTRAYDGFKGAAMLSAGSFYHCVTCKSSGILTGLELEAAKTIIDAVRSLDLICQTGQYRRRDDLLTPELLRVYEMVGTGANCIVPIRK